MIEFFVPGIPRPGGSKRAVKNKRTGKVILIDACKLNKSWRDTVAAFAMDAYRGELLHGALKVEFAFTMPRPKSHYRAGKYAGELKPNAPKYPITRPDRTKLIRSTEDALTGVIWRDDAQIVGGEPTKLYGDKPGVLITIQEAE